MLPSALLALVLSTSASATPPENAEGTFNVLSFPAPLPAPPPPAPAAAPRPAPAERACPAADAPSPAAVAVALASGVPVFFLATPPLYVERASLRDLEVNTEVLEVTPVLVPAPGWRDAW